MKKSPEFEVKDESSLLPFLLECFNSKSRNYVKGILQRGQVRVDGQVCTDYAHPLMPGQRIGVSLGREPEGPKLSFPVIYEDEDLIAVDKPVGMLSVSDGNERENTAYHMVTEYVKGRSGFGHIFVVHRLDRDTSGVMLFAKSERVKLALQEKWNEAVSLRGYLAVVEGLISPPAGQVKSWLKETQTLQVYSSEKAGDGKLAITNYKTIKTAGGYSLLEISLETGRKNQIRVHMRDLGHPVAGDKKYGARTDPFKRLGLHASALHIQHPRTGAELRLESAPPAAFLKLFKP